MKRLKKLARIMSVPLYARALLEFGVPAGSENDKFLRGRNFMTIADVGANRGQFLLSAKRNCPGAAVMSFEPVPSAAAKLEKLAARLGNVQVHRVALGAAAGSAAICVPSRNDESSMALELDGNTFEVPVRTLDDVLYGRTLARPALLKIDVQGYEMSVLSGAERVLPLFDDLYVEVTFAQVGPRHSPAADVVAWLHERSFELMGVYNPAAHGKPWHACDMHFRRIARDAVAAKEPKGVVFGPRAVAG